MKKIINVFLLSLILGLIGFKLGQVILNLPQEKYDYQKLLDKWTHSQHNLNQGYQYRGMMEDKELYTLAALDYSKGNDPTIINFEHPPLGKYLLGFSDKILGNVIYIQLFASVLILLLTYSIGRSIKIPAAYSLLSVLLLISDPLFGKYLTYVNLEIIHLFFVLLALYLLLNWESRGKLAPVFLGLGIGGVLSTKAIFNGLVMFGFTVIALCFKQKKPKTRQILTIIIFCFLAYLAAYSVFFKFHDFVDFIYLHLKILRFFRSYLPDYPWFEIFRILILGRWRTWFADPAIQPVADFWPVWPLSFFVFFWLFLKKGLTKKGGEKVKIILFWNLIYFGYSSVHVVFPNYLLPVIPSLYLCLTYALSEILVDKNTKPVIRILSVSLQRFFSKKTF